MGRLAMTTLDAHPHARYGRGMDTVTKQAKIVCECIMDCANDPSTRCSLSGEWHVHPGEPCAMHPDAPGDK